MKKNIIFTAVLLFVINAVNAQGKYPVAKAYAYSQKEISGVNRKVMDKEGKIIRSKNVSSRFYLYLECYAGKEIELNSIWVNGRAYQFTTKKVSSPVVVQSGIKGVNNAGSETLVPQTANDVLVVFAGEEAGLKTNRKMTRLTKNNAVLFEYSYNEKKYYLAVKSIKEIAPEVNQ